ncbi:hypothetical protein M9H77_21548 [Catharanthus roseus]|uniref:Uncharacterized protein n=1 Tax=Catharanthus roseus TaxID=4058 RepID=A0ACC0APP7_CATRO|nr:hypothetical protein M9H77_21548 [Catharanthus roseus]
MTTKSKKVDELSQAQDVVDRKVIHHEKKNTCTFIKEGKSYTMNALSPQQFHEEQRKMREKRRVSLNEEQSIIESISISLEECEHEKSVVSTKKSKGKRKKSECLTEINESLKKNKWRKSKMILKRLRKQRKRREFFEKHDLAKGRLTFTRRLIRILFKGLRWHGLELEFRIYGLSPLPTFLWQPSPGGGESPTRSCPCRND